MQLPHAFFNRPADEVARDLLGAYLCVRIARDVIRLPITETEAYLGPHDKACHSSRGRTKRTEVMYGDAGTIYVYFIYGMYYMLNIVTGEKEYPAAVLIRGAGPYDGPGKLTRALGIDLSCNGALLSSERGVWIEAGETPVRIAVTPRIGVAYAGAWAKRKLRFVCMP